MRAGTALSFARHLRFDLLVVGFPLTEVRWEELVAEVRGTGSANAQTPILLLAEPDDIAGARRAAADRLTEVASAETAPAELRERVASLLGIAKRAGSRIMVELRAEIGRGTMTRLCQTRDVSESGMLLRTLKPLPIGTRLAVRLTLPDDSRPLEGDVEVVRHSRDGRAMGLRFIDLGTEGAGRLRDLVRRAGEGATA